jgi:ATP-dependent DNA helicase DinG
VIFDEAHEMEDVAGNYFGISVSNLRVEDLARDVEASLQHHRMMSAGFLVRSGSLRERSQFFFSLLPPGKVGLRSRRGANSGRKRRRVSGAESGVDAAGGRVEGLPQKPEEVFNFVRRAQEIQVQLGYAMESEDRNTVFWIERRAGRFRGRLRTKKNK